LLRLYERTGAVGGPVTNNGVFGRGGKDGVNDVIIATTRIRFSF